MVEVHDAPGEGTFADVHWSFGVTKDGTGKTCRTSVALGENPAGDTGGQCATLDRLEYIFVVDRGVGGAGGVSYAAGIHAAQVTRLRLLFDNGSEATSPVTGDTFLALWEGVDNLARIEVLNDKDRVLQKCNLGGNVDPC